ncbi:MAG: aminotransferase class I/II-fold pyridoxal phosphate-dependent enzyme [Epsilonproteobacteria bacterium]|nr:aminotransferase class I/II-fold pyridoxal phosphate-dependent enzyme [Campylobacterota bacterium]
MLSNASSPKRPAEKVTPFEVMAIVRRASAQPDAVRFEVGEPDLPPPPGVREALKNLPAKAYGYTPSAGLWALREKIARWYETEQNLSIDPMRIFVTPGSSAALLSAYWLVLGPQDRVVMADPSYPCYRNFARLQGIEARVVPTRAEEGYMISPDVLCADDRAVHILSPANPTGGVYAPSALKALAKRCRALDVALISDELYQGLWYEQKPPSALAFDENALVTNGFSKSFCMPGFRLGWIVVPERLMESMERLAQNLYLCAPTPMQYAALEAFDSAYLEEVRLTFKARREWLVSRLARFFDLPCKPQGAFYVWCDVSPYYDDSGAFCRDLWEKERVSATPGGDFGPGGRRFVRFAFTREIAVMEEGIRRLARFLSNL